MSEKKNRFELADDLEAKLTDLDETYQDAVDVLRTQCAGIVASHPPLAWDGKTITISGKTFSNSTLAQKLQQQPNLLHLVEKAQNEMRAAMGLPRKTTTLERETIREQEYHEPREMPAEEVESKPRKSRFA